MPEEPYHVKERDGHFQVLDGAGRLVMVCQDENSAAQYVVLLNEAYHRGHKAGRRQARASDDPSV